MMGRSSDDFSMVENPKTSHKATNSRQVCLDLLKAVGKNKNILPNGSFIVISHGRK